MAAPLLFVSGPPAAGKTTLAARLAPALGLALLGKDTIKEALGEALGADGVEASRRLGRAAIVVLYALARAQLEAGAGVLVETPLHRGVSEPDLAPLLARGRAALIHCRAAPAVLLERYRSRAAAGTRHPVHADDRRIVRGEDAFLGTHHPPAVRCRC